MTAITARLFNHVSAGFTGQAHPTEAPVTGAPPARDSFISSKTAKYAKIGLANAAIGAGCMAIAHAAGASVAGQVALAIVPASIAFAALEGYRGAKSGAAGGGEWASMGAALGFIGGAAGGALEGLIKAPIVYAATTALASVPAIASFGLPTYAIGGAVGLALYGVSKAAQHLLSK